MKVLATILILSLVSLSIQAEADKCNTFKCASGTTVPEGTCVKKVTVNDKKVGHIALCTSPKVCEATWSNPVVDESKCVDVSVPKKENLVDGETCAETSECFKGVECKDKKCSGKPKESDCTDTRECATGFYCSLDNKKCSEQIKDEKTECKSDEECANNLTCVGKACVSYNSQSEGTVVRTNYACKSGDATQDGMELKCSTSTLSGEWKCGKDQTQCEYKVKMGGDEKTIKADCMCNFSSPNTLYCPADTSKVDSVLKNVKTTSGVHTTRRFEQGNVGSISWPYLEEADSCLKALLSSSFIKSAFLSLAALVIML